jgi:hypothetical protein
MELEKVVAEGVTATGLGAGVMFTLAPQLVSKFAGWKTPNAERDLLSRIVGARDFALGSLLWLARNEPKKRAGLLTAFGFCIFTDGLAALLALGKAENKAITWLVAIASFVIGSATIWAGTKLKKEA